MLKCSPFLPIFKQDGLLLYHKKYKQLLLQHKQKCKNQYGDSPRARKFYFHCGPLIKGFTEIYITSRKNKE